MAGSNNFLVWDAAKTNAQDDATYLADSNRAGGVPTNAIFQSLLANKAFGQWSIMVAALGQMLSDKGFHVSDADFNALKAVLSNILVAADLPAFNFSRNIYTTGQEIVHQNTLAETILYSTTIPANTLGSRVLRVQGLLIPQAQGANLTTVRIRLGGQVMAAYAYNASNLTLIRLASEINARNSSPGLQFALSQVAATLTAFASTTYGEAWALTNVDTTVDQVAALTVQSGSLTDNQRFENFSVNLL